MCGKFSADIVCGSRAPAPRMLNPDWVLNLPAHRVIGVGQTFISQDNTLKCVKYLLIFLFSWNFEEQNYLLLGKTFAASLFGRVWKILIQRQIQITYETSRFDHPLIYWLSLTNTNPEANPNNSLMMRRAGLSKEKVPKFLPRYNLGTLPGKI